MLITNSSLKNNIKVDNAIIMAAGLSSRFAPLSLEKPKGLLEVKGEVLIERQIKQLKEAGINDITVVVGYMKEKFYYLKDKFNVEIIFNKDFNTRNNNSTLYLVRNKLKNTYICSSDNYFTKNVFESYVHTAYYSAVYCSEETNEYCITTDENDIITNVVTQGKDCWIMLGHAYFSEDFSRKFVNILEEVYNNPCIDDMLWEDIYINNIDKLSMKMRKYDSSVILEFDNLDELRAFDTSYITDSRSQIIKNISSILNCKEGEVINIIPKNKELSNFSFLFEVNGDKYIYYHKDMSIHKL